MFGSHYAVHALQGQTVKHQEVVEVKHCGKSEYSNREPDGNGSANVPRGPFSVNALQAVTKQFIGRLGFNHKNDYLAIAVANVKDSVFSSALLKH